MTCNSCEQRRQWMKEQYERSKERMRLCIERLTPRANRAEQPTDSAKQSTHSDQQ